MRSTPAPPTRDLLKPEKLHHRVRRRHHPVPDLRYEVPFEIAVHPGGLADEIAVVGDVGLRRQIQQFVPDAKHDSGERLLQFIGLSSRFGLRLRMGCFIVELKLKDQYSRNREWCHS